MDFVVWVDFRAGVYIRNASFREKHERMIRLANSTPTFLFPCSKDKGKISLIVMKGKSVFIKN